MRALVVGGSGQIGGWLLRKLAARGHHADGTYHTVAQSGLIPLDAGNLARAAELVRSKRPDVVFYPAGFTWVDGCERDPARAWASNVEQPLNLARASVEVGARFVYFSTDYVFDGVAGPYDEASAADPLSAYGRSKLEAEESIAREAGDQQLTVRTSWVFGPERQGKNFAYQLAKTLAAGKTLECPSDQLSSPSYAPDVAEAVVELIEARASGLVHVAGPETIDRVSFARAIAQRFRLDPAGIIGRTTAELGQGAPRPLRGGLKTPRLDAFRPRAMRSLEESLADFVTTLESDDWARPY